MLRAITPSQWIVIVVTLVTLTIFGTQQWKIHSLRTEVAESKVDLEKMGRRLDQCQSAVEVQNEAIDHWKADAENRSKKAQAAIAEASKARQAAQQRAQRLYSIVMTGDECADIKSVIDTARAGGL